MLHQGAKPGCGTQQPDSGNFVELRIFMSLPRSFALAQVGHRHPDLFRDKGDRSELRLSLMARTRHRTSHKRLRPLAANQTTTNTIRAT